MLYERGIIFSQGIPAFERGMKEVLSGTEVPEGVFMHLLREQWKEYHAVNERIEHFY